MKEILKYLRQVHAYTQEAVAQKIGISRQSYLKYESGAVVPTDKIVSQLAELYAVEKQFIYKNEIPAIPTPANKDVQYHIPPNFGLLQVASPDVYAFPTTSARGTPYSTKGYDVYFDGNALRVTNDKGSHFVEGQRFKLVPVDTMDRAERRKKAFETIERIVSHKKPYAKTKDDDPYYKEALYQARMEKYGSLT